MKRKKKSLLPALAKNSDAELGEVNEHYIAAAQWCMRAKYLLLVLFVLYLVVMLSLYRSYITYDNLAYLLRDFGSDSSLSVVGFEDISYDEQTNMDFEVYKGELAVAGGEKITLYNSASTKTFEYESGMENPVLCPSGKYLLAYDLGGKKFSLFNNLTRVFDSEDESILENAAVSDNGEFVLVKRARDTKYTVSYYSSSFENESNYYKSSFVSDAAISRDGKVVAIASVDISGASFSSVIEFYGRGEESVSAQYSCGGLLPINIGSFADGSFYAVCDGAVLFFDPNGVFLSRYDTSVEKVVAVDPSDVSLCVALSRDVMNGSGTIIIFDNVGNISYNIETDYKVSDISHNSTCVYTLEAENIHKYTYGEAGDSHESIVCDFGTVFVRQVGDFALVGTKSQTTAVFDSDAEKSTERS